MTKKIMKQRDQDTKIVFIRGLGKEQKKEKSWTHRLKRAISNSLKKVGIDFELTEPTQEIQTTITAPSPFALPVEQDKPQKPEDVKEMFA